MEQEKKLLEEQILGILKKNKDLFKGARGPPGADAMVSDYMLERYMEKHGQSLIMKGLRGNRGEVGPKGDKGKSGDKGIQGEKGERGEKGESGVKGDQGERGETGEKGDKGEQGEKGEAGIAGERGEKGETGMRGELGEKGEKGDKGEQGIQGWKGDKGERGDNFLSNLKDCQPGEFIRYDTNEGWHNIGSRQICIGKDTSFTEGVLFSVAIGNSSGRFYQGEHCTAVGYMTGNEYQSECCTAVGAFAGSETQGYGSTAIGYYAGLKNQGKYSIGIGFKAGTENQHNNTTIINSTGDDLITKTSHATYIAPVRDIVTGDKKYPNNCVPLLYNTVTKEIVTSTS